MRVVAALFAVAAAASSAGAAQAPPAALAPAHWLPDGPVHAIVRQGDRLYVGGDFTRFGPPSGSGVVVDGVTGERAPAFPQIVGTVSAAAPDGAGGWYVGGDFTRVGGQPRTRLAHLLANGRLDPAWRPAAGARVNALLTAGDRVYVGGDFETIGGVRRAGVAALDAKTGAVESWNPRLSGSVFVFALAAAGTNVFVGDFDGLHVVDAGTARVVKTFGLAPVPDAGETTTAVYALAVEGRRLYAGGIFGRFAGAARASLAAVDVDTLEVDANWRPQAAKGAEVDALATSPTRVYAGGTFGAAALDPASGAAVRGWTLSPKRASPAVVRALALQGARLYVAGSSAGFVGRVRFHVAAADARTGAVTESWDPRPNADPLVVTPSATRLFVGGAFSMVGGSARRYLAALHVATGRLVDEWNPGASAPVMALAAANGRLYVGGQFNTLGGKRRLRLGAVDLKTGALDEAFDPRAGGEVDAVAVVGTRLYAGGQFRTMGGKPRLRLAAVDARTGALDPRWAPAASGTVWALAPAAGRVYAGGTFRRVGAATRALVAALDPTTGAVLPWTAQIRDASGYYGVRAIVPTGGRVYVGGTFTVSEEVQYLAAYDPRTGRVSSGWSFVPSSNVMALASGGGRLYVGGPFDDVHGEQHSGLVAVRPATGAVDPAWPYTAEPTLNVYTVRALAVAGSRVYVGGEFKRIRGVPWAYLAALPR